MIEFGKAVCYSGYRKDQSPRTHVYPSYQDVLEDLRILEKEFDYIRMYDVSTHPETVLQVISENNIKLKVMLGVEPGGEISNPNCPWGGLQTEEQIAFHKVHNYKQLDQAAALANRYKDIVLAVSVGNECTSDWHHALMAPETMAAHARYLKSLTDLPVTFCEGAYYWRTKGAPIAKEVDFISIHSYPLWQRVNVDEAIQMNLKDYNENKEAYPDKQVIFTEMGWATMSNEQMDSTQTNEENQDKYLKAVDEWSQKEGITMFYFEAFDEPWKGSNNPIEPEKHWGIFNEDRTPKQYMKHRMGK